MVEQRCSCLILVVFISFSSGLRLHPCGSAGYVEVVENEHVTLTCDQYSGSLIWSVSSNTIGSCNATSCDVPIFPLFSLKYINASSSSFTSTSTSRAAAGFIFQCSELATGNVKACRLHVIVPAVLGTLNITESTPTAGWTVSGDVTISKVYSSRGLYTCVWSVKQDNGQYTEVVTKTPTFDPVVANAADRTGHCDFTNQPLPSNSGTYTYRVVVSPGQTSATDSSVVIASPAQPIYNCGSSDYVSEGTNVNCTCSGSVGRPPGRLVWLKDNTPIKVGTYGDVSLMLTMAVNRTDDGDVLRCDVDWITRTEGSPYILSIAFPPTNTTLSVAGNKTLTVNENQAVTFDCQSRGRPSPHLTLGRTGNDVVLSQQDGGMTSQVEGNTHLTFTFTARCSSTDTYTCTADNHHGSTQQDAITLFVICAPEQAATPPGDIAVISLTQRVATFTVAAFPTPTISSLFRRLPDGSFSDQLVDIFFTTQCQRTSIVTLDVICNVTMIGMTSTSAAGMYFATVMNSLGSMEVEFRVEFGEPTHQEESSSELSAGAGAGIMAAVMILIVTVIAVALVIWLRRRDWILPCNPSRNHTSPSKRESVSSIPQHQPGHQPSCGLADQSSLEGRHALGQEEPEVPNNYDELRLQEVGLRSVYSEISSYRNTGARGDNPERGPVYENNDSTQTSPYSNVHTA